MRIDQATVQKIIDTADIVDVVSDYVRLKRRGSGYIGLCPFHNERTPSFSVSKSKGLCKCFSCGKGGGPVSFIMEIEQISYPEALKFLARKYGIEIEERELTPEEKKMATERESMMAINAFAMEYFEKNLVKSREGLDIGLPYFKERGINDLMIKKFHLGYSLEQRDSLYKAAVAAGYNPEYLEKTGLCMRTESGEIRDRFRERVIYPIFTISGKVVGFGGRTLRSDKTKAKYVNSPESSVYKKSYELYGLYQAKPAIARKDKCILVEGYMDVISMHQAGIENVVASSGTSLTTGQISLLHRFTENVTVIYDSDAAGIKASLRGIDMLLAEGMKVKVLLLPDGDDPDSFAQAHSSSEVEEYIAANETDFVQFKTSVLLKGTDNDPISRSRAITDIVNTIAVIPDMILRTSYISECSRTLGMSETLLTLQVNKQIAERNEKEAKEEARRKNRRDAGLPPETDEDIEKNEDLTPDPPVAVQPHGLSYPLAPYEKEILRYALRYGVVYMGDIMTAEGNLTPMSVLEYVRREMRADDLEFTYPPYKAAFEAAMEVAANNWSADFEAFNNRLESELAEETARGETYIRDNAPDMAAIKRGEEELRSRIEESRRQRTEEFAEAYLGRILAASQDSVIRDITIDLVSSKHKLSKIHTKFSKVETERDKLSDLVPLAVYNLKEAIIRQRILALQQRIKQLYLNPEPDLEEIKSIMAEQLNLEATKKEIAVYLGERTIAPHPGLFRR